MKPGALPHGGDAVPFIVEVGAVARIDGKGGLLAVVSRQSLMILIHSAVFIGQRQIIFALRHKGDHLPGFLNGNTADVIVHNGHILAHRPLIRRSRLRHVRLLFVAAQDVSALVLQAGQVADGVFRRDVVRIQNRGGENKILSGVIQSHKKNPLPDLWDPIIGGKQHLTLHMIADCGKIVDNALSPGAAIGLCQGKDVFDQHRLGLQPLGQLHHGQIQKIAPVIGLHFSRVGESLTRGPPHQHVNALDPGILQIPYDLFDAVVAVEVQLHGMCIAVVLLKCLERGVVEVHAQNHIISGVKKSPRETSGAAEQVHTGQFTFHLYTSLAKIYCRMRRAVMGSLRQIRRQIYRLVSVCSRG